jgi:hypothetical protein
MEEKFEAIMEAVCDMCHWPYACCDGELDERCLNCPAERKIRELMANA